MTYTKEQKTIADSYLTKIMVAINSGNDEEYNKLTNEFDGLKREWDKGISDE